MAHIPNLIQPVTVGITPVDKLATEYSRTAREPVRQAARGDAVTCPAQVQWSLKDRRQPGQAGVSNKSSGYLIFRVVDLAARSYQPAPGDRVDTIPGVSGVWYLTGTEPCGHREGRNQLELWYFEDRQPTRAG